VSKSTPEVYFCPLCPGIVLYLKSGQMLAHLKKHGIHVKAKDLAQYKKPEQK